MRPGDRVLFYESVTTKAVVGTAEVTRAAFPDQTADEPGWVAVELKAGKEFAQPVTLEQIKAEPALAKMALLRISRLSVQPVARVEFERIVKLGKG
jgi:predicted RNA-binding protein with PUA-like domain